MKPRVSQLARSGATDGQAIVWSDSANQYQPGSPSGVTVRQLFPFTYTGVVALLTGTQRLYVERACTVITTRASVGTAPTGAALVVDINKNGTTIFTTQANRPQIAAGTNTDLGGTPDITALAAGDYLTVDVDQIGSSTAGSDLVVTVEVSIP